MKPVVVMENVCAEALDLLFLIEFQKYLLIIMLQNLHFLKILNGIVNTVLFKFRAIAGQFCYLTFSIPSPAWSSAGAATSR